MIALALGAAAAAGGCSGGELDPGAPPLLTLEECRQLGGAPLFDPMDERPLASSCPERLAFIGVFEEPFFGSDGGICCGAPERELSPPPDEAGGAQAGGEADPGEPAETGAAETGADAGAADVEPGGAEERDETHEPDAGAASRR